MVVPGPTKLALIASATRKMDGHPESERQQEEDGCNQYQRDGCGWAGLRNLVV